MKFFVYDCLIFTLLISVSYILDGYLNAPFDKVDVFAIFVSLPILLILAGLFTKMFLEFDRMSKTVKVIITVPAFINACLIVALIGPIMFGFGV
ncbi:hypothetical protein H0266_15250 [Halobacillus locisalis]|uniref:Uncharacterized protein n=1 Tax=Halobacillus locisalis TaxID=220753 RepID=A0A838CWG0_9BACI|nr:hypothetical protein [Halobacillus locisalis]MBA2176253.1 hypothetical protein [Halobacillus locisalis]